MQCTTINTIQCNITIKQCNVKNRVLENTFITLIKSRLGEVHGNVV